MDYATGVKHDNKSLPPSIDVAMRVLELGSDRDAVIATLLSDPALQVMGAWVASLTQLNNATNAVQALQQQLMANQTGQ